MSKDPNGPSAIQMGLPAYQIAAPLPQCEDAAQMIAWQDEEPGNVYRVLEFDNQLKIPFQQSVGFWTTCGGLAMLYCVPALLTPIIYPCISLNIRDRALAEHAALTRDGLRYVIDSHPTSCRWPMCDAGAESKTVPFDRLQDVQVIDPAGNTCCCIKNVVSTVKVQTAAQGGGAAEISIIGLKYPHEFRKVMIAMKRAEQMGGLDDGTGAGMGTRSNNIYQNNGGGGGGGGGGNSELAPLLQQLSSQINSSNQYLRDIAQNTYIEAKASQQRVGNYN